MERFPDCGDPICPIGAGNRHKQMDVEEKDTAGSRYAVQLFHVADFAGDHDRYDFFYWSRGLGCDCTGV